MDDLGQGPENERVAAGTRPVRVRGNTGGDGHVLPRDEVGARRRTLDSRSGR